MAFSNKMSVLLDKIERRLGTQGLNLPPELQKDVWVKVIEQDTIPTFSRYFPHKIEMYLGPEDLSKKEPATYLIDENKIPGDIEIIGVGDISWKNLYNNPRAASSQYGLYGAYDGYSLVGFEDFALTQLSADSCSLFNAGIYIEFEPANKVRLRGSINQDMGSSLGHFPVEVFLMHPSNLQTISQFDLKTIAFISKIEENKERLAKDDVATFLYGQLKLYDNFPILFGGESNLRLESIEEAMNDRENVMDIINEGYVGAANTNQPICYSIQ